MHFTGTGFLLLAIACNTAMTIALKLFRNDENNRYAIILGNYVTCVAVGFFLLPDRTAVFRAAGTTVLLGTVGGVLFASSLVLIQRSIHTNGAILTSAFSKLGLLVPLAASVLFFREMPSALQYAGLLLALFAFWVLRGKTDEKETASPLLLAAVLFSSGLADVMAKVFDQFGAEEENALYILFVFFTAGILATLFLLREWKRTGKKAAPRDFLAGIAVGIPNYFSSTFLLRSLATVPSFIAFTVFSTGVLILVTVIGTVFLRERPTKRQLAGIAIILAALVLLNV